MTTAIATERPVAAPHVYLSHGTELRAWARRWKGMSAQSREGVTNLTRTVCREARLLHLLRMEVEL